jgi:hypothetical protein
LSITRFASVLSWLVSTDVVENQHDMECVAVVEAKAAIGPVG